MHWNLFGPFSMAAARDATMDAMSKMYVVRPTSSRDRGEVFTPFEMVEQMLDALPSRVWSNPDGRWLDPASGFGVFSVMAFFRLMRGLAKEIPEAGARARHIVGEMLFMVEIDKANVQRTKALFAMLTTTPPNVKCADYLEWSGRGRFDVVMGNPPYNNNGFTKGGAFWYSYWAPFVLRSIDRLKAGGVLLFVHPPGWRKPAGRTRSSGDVWKRFRAEGRILRLVTEEKRRPPFPEVDWYAWQRGVSRGSTLVSSPGGNAKVRLSSLPFLPGVITRHTIGILKKVIAAQGEQTYEFVRDNRFRFPAREALGDIPHAHYWSQEDNAYKTLGLSMAQVLSMYPRGVPGFYSKCKVVLSMNAARVPGCLFPAVYKEGRCVGVTSNVVYQVMDEGEAARCVAFLSSKLVRAVMRMCQYSPAPHRKNEPGVINSLRVPPPAALRSEKSLAEYYGLTPAESDFVSSHSSCL